MANEFKIKNGLVSDGNIVVTGSITATGGINISGSIASAETASFAPSYTLSSSFNSYTSSASSSVGSLSSSVATTTSELSSSIGSLSGSVATTTSGLASRIGSVETKTGSYATTGSNIFIGDQTITGSICSNGNIVTTGQIVAQTINVQQVTSSIVYSCGSNIFGNVLSNTQQFTGSVLVTGSLTIVGASSATSYGGATIYGSTAVCSPVGKFTSCIDAGSATFSGAISGTCATFTNNVNITNTGGAMALSFKRTDSPVGTGAIYFKDSCDNIDASISHNVTIGVGLEFGTCGTNRMYITNGGNIGIGTSSPVALDSGGVNLQIKDRSALFQLAAVNSTYLSNNIYYDGSWKRIVSGYGTLIRLTDDNNGFSFLTTGTAGANCAVTFTSAMNITNTGNVGIGVSSPFSKLSLPSGTGWNGGLTWDYTSANGASKRWWINTDQITYGDFRIATEKTQGAGIISCASTLCERFYINASGGVGIGTTNPSAYGFLGVVGTVTHNTLTGVVAGFSDDILGTTRLYIQSGVNGVNVDQAFAVSTGGGVPVERMRISTTGVATFTSSTTGLDNITIKNASNKTNVIIGSAGGTALFGGMQMFDNTSTAAVYLITDTSANSYLFSGLSIGANLASYKLQISTDSAGKPNGGSWANSSDIRLKENIHTIDNALHKITQLRGVTFDWKDETEQDNIKSSAGFIADEVMLTFPNWVKEVNSSDKQKEIVNDDKIKSLSLPFEFDALLVEAIKELKAEIDELKNK